ncbi:MAG: hypothetical protein U0547_01235 [Dehalococcoidia bacterium]
MSILVLAVVVGGGLAAWRQSREAAALPARAAAMASLAFEPTGALIGPDGSDTLLGTLRAPAGIDRVRLSVLATSNPGCPVSAFTLTLAPTSSTTGEIHFALAPSAPNACEGARIDWGIEFPVSGSQFPGDQPRAGSTSPPG